MGAHSVQITSKITDPSAAYRDLVDSALRESGHDAYNGTISTTSGFRVFSHTPMTAPNADRVANERLESLAKWGVCEAVAVGTSTRVRTIKKTIDATPTGEASFVTVDEKLIAAKTGIAIEQIAALRVVDSKPVYRFRTVPAGPSRRMWTTSRGGEFATRADAVAAVKQKLARPSQSSGASVYGFERVEVFQRTVRTPEAAIERTLSSWKVRVEIDLVDSGAPFDAFDRARSVHATTHRGVSLV